MKRRSLCSGWWRDESGGGRKRMGFDHIAWIRKAEADGYMIKAYVSGLGDYVLSRGEWADLRREVLERDNYYCVYCGDEATAVDHVFPRCIGGITVERNLVAACKSCNSRKGGRL